MNQPDDSMAITIRPCDNTEAHHTHVWTPEPSFLNGPKRCPGVRTADSIGPDGFTRLAETDYRAAFFRVFERCNQWWRDLTAALGAESDYTGGCYHQWLERPESDTRECLICGTEVSG